MKQDKTEEYLGEAGEMWTTSYALIDYGDGPRCAWCKKKRPSNKHLEWHDQWDKKIRTDAITEAIECLPEEKTWGSNGSKFEDQSVSEELYQEQLKVLAFNQCLKEVKSRLEGLRK